MATPGETSRDDEGYRLWQRLRDRDPVASSDLALAYLDRLSSWIQQHHPRVPEHDCTTAAGDAIFSLCQRPQIYDPEKQSLEVFLRMAATRDLQNLQRSEHRHARRRADLEDVELSPMAGKYLADETTDPARVVDAAEFDLDPDLIAFLDGLSTEEKQVLRLWQDGERRTSAFAKALAITHRSTLEQAREIKRVKDRLKKRLERWRENRDG